VQLIGVWSTFSAQLTTVIEKHQSDQPQLQR